MAFASGTWDGWDYIPHAWPVWLAAKDGVLLVACPGSVAEGTQPTDSEGAPLSVGRPIALARVAMVSRDEAWLEGIRVDPKVRGLDVATDLQVAELHWAAAQGVNVIRYATGAHNEASHRLGARHDFSLLVVFRAWWWSATGSAEDDDREPSAFDPAVRASTTARRQALLGRLAESGAVATPDEAEGLWRSLSADATFELGRRLYEPRPWAMQELNQEAFRGHLQRGEVLVGKAPPQESDAVAVAILVREQMPAEDSALRLALLAGDGSAAVRLADQARQLAAETIRFRLPDRAPLLAGHEEDFAAAGFVTPDWELHVLERPIDASHAPPAFDPAALVLADPPLPTLEPPAR